MAEQDK